MPYLNAKLDGLQFVRLGNARTLFNASEALPMLLVESPFCSAVIALQGAQVLAFTPANDQPWLWLSPHARFENGQAIRGGIPVCLPWFGVNRQDPAKPKHGFVRSQPWQLVNVKETDKEVQLTLAYTYQGEQPELFTAPFSATLLITLSNTLKLDLQVHNPASETLPVSWAFHTYLAVDDCETATVHGLENHPYLDNTRQLQTFSQAAPVTFRQEVDRVYNHTVLPQRVHAGQNLVIAGENCPSCIVWNAGAVAASSLSDIGAAWRHYICVERGCAFEDSLQIAAGETFRSSMSISR